MRYAPQCPVCGNRGPCNTCKEVESKRPSDILLPAGWDWDRVEAARAHWGISDNMVPVAAAHGTVAWGTINSVRLLREKGL